MGNKNSKQKNAQKNKKKTKPSKIMPYKREFSTENARKMQSIEYQKSLTEARSSQQNTPIPETKIPQSAVSQYSDILDPKKYKPPPEPLTQSELTNDTKQSDEENIDTVLDDTIDEDPMTLEEAECIKRNTQRSLSPGTNISDLQILDDTNSNSSLSHKRVESQKIHEIYHKVSQLPQTLLWGYCELTRKQLDEDQAAFLTWTHQTEGFVHAWAIFDGHGGYEAALYSAQHFLKYLEKYHYTRKTVSTEEWAVLLKEVFLKFDAHIKTLNIRGGSTVVVVLLIKTRLIVANAGDARAIFSNQNGQALPLSYDHTPMNDYDRLLQVSKKKENYAKIQRYFRLNTKMETKKDFSKLPIAEKQKAPFVCREMDKSRLLGTIGVARGFGDYNLSVFGFKNIYLKPFLSAEPYVKIVELRKAEIEDTDLMCIACDGIFDVMKNQKVIELLRQEIFFRKPEDMEEKKQDGSPIVRDTNLLTEPNLDVKAKVIDRACTILGYEAYRNGTMDDVSVFVVPLKQIFGLPHNLNQ